MNQPRIETKSKRWLLWVSLSVAVVLIAGAGAFFYFYESDKDSDTSTEISLSTGESGRSLSCEVLNEEACLAESDCMIQTECNCINEIEMAQQCGLEVDNTCICSIDTFSGCVPLECKEGAISPGKALSTIYPRVEVEADNQEWEQVSYENSQIKASVQVPLEWTTTTWPKVERLYNQSIISSGNDDVRFEVIFHATWDSEGTQVDDRKRSHEQTAGLVRVEEWSGSIGTHKTEVYDYYHNDVSDEERISRLIILKKGDYYFEITLRATTDAFSEYTDILDRIVGSLILINSEENTVELEPLLDTIDYIRNWKRFGVDHGEGYVFYQLEGAQRAVMNTSFDLSEYGSAVTSLGILFWKLGPQYNYSMPGDSEWEIEYRGGTNPEFIWWGFEDREFVELPGVRFKSTPEKFERVYRVIPSTSEMKLLIEVGEYDIWSDAFLPGLTSQNPFHSHGLVYDIETNTFSSGDPLSEFLRLAGLRTTQWNKVGWDSQLNRFFAAPGGEGCGAYNTITYVDLDAGTLQLLGGEGSYTFEPDGCNPKNGGSPNGKYFLLSGRNTNDNTDIYLFTHASAPYPAAYFTDREDLIGNYSWVDSVEEHTDFPVLYFNDGARIDFNEATVVDPNNFDEPYLKETEYPFDSCLGIDGYQKRQWYDNLITHINERLKFYSPDDFTDACLSLDDKQLILLAPKNDCEGIGIFKGYINAENINLSNSEIPFNDSECLVPAQEFGKRNGDYIPIVGQKEENGCTTTMTYHYYYRQNLLEVYSEEEVCT